MKKHQKYAPHFVDIGAAKPIVKEELIGIFDLDRAETSRELNEFLRAASGNGSLAAYDGEEIPKSFVLTTGGVSLSPLNAETIGGRAGELEMKR